MYYKSVQIIIIIAITFVFYGSCKNTENYKSNSQTSNTQTNNARIYCRSGICDVSIVNLIASPERFHKKKIRVMGVASIQFEGTAIYLTKDCYKYHIYKNAIWIDLPGKNLNGLKSMDGKYIIIEGIFDATKSGHMSANSGLIDQISRLDFWEINYVKSKLPKNKGRSGT